MLFLRTEVPKRMGADVHSAFGILVHTTRGARVSERIDHLKAADAADIEMGGFFLCEVDAFTCESTDAQ